MDKLYIGVGNWHYNVEVVHNDEITSKLLRRFTNH